MTNENATIEKLIQKGFVTKEQIKEVSLEGIDDTMNSCAMLMHSLFCQRKHEYDVEKMSDSNYYRHKSFVVGLCFWYAEQTLETCWQELEHKYWLNRCANEMERQELKLPKELHDFLLIVTKAAGEIHFLKAKYPNAGELLKELL